MEAGTAGSLAAWRSRDYRLYQAARCAVVIGAEAQALAVAWQVYQITHRALDLGYTGLALFLPALLFLLPGGHVADRFDRRTVVLVCYALQSVCTLLLLGYSWAGTPFGVLPIYGVLFLVGTGRAFSGPASSALIPHLVPKEHFVNAVTWGASIFQIATVAGPSVGGLLYTLHMVTPRLAGGGIVYLFTFATLVWYVVLVGKLRVRVGRLEKKATSWHTLLAGVRYVLRTEVLLGSISLDLFAVLLGGSVALLPIFAENILHTGPRGLGLLRAAPGVGALAVSLFLTFRPIQRSAGVRMLVCVGLFGAATIVFGLSRTFTLSLLALLITGAADMVSVVIRSSILQLATPLEMRGRVSAVNALFLGASNELGEFESGLTAHWFGTVRAVVLGGIGSVAVTGIWAVGFPHLRSVGALSAESLAPKAVEQSAVDTAVL